MTACASARLSWRARRSFRRLALRATCRAAAYSQPATEARHAPPRALRASRRNAAWQASSASWAWPSTRRQAASTMPACRRARTANAASSPASAYRRSRSASVARARSAGSAASRASSSVASKRRGIVAALLHGFPALKMSARRRAAARRLRDWPGLAWRCVAAGLSVRELLPHRGRAFRRPSRPGRRPRSAGPGRSAFPTEYPRLRLGVSARRGAHHVCEPTPLPRRRHRTALWCSCKVSGRRRYITANTAASPAA